MVSVVLSFVGCKCAPEETTTDEAPGPNISIDLRYEVGERTPDGGEQTAGGTIVVSDGEATVEWSADPNLDGGSAPPFNAQGALDATELERIATLIEKTRLHEATEFEETLEGTEPFARVQGTVTLGDATGEHQIIVASDRPMTERSPEGKDAVFKVDAVATLVGELGAMLRE